MTRSVPYIRLVLLSVGLGVAVMESGCDGTPNNVSASKPIAEVSPSGLVTLSAEESVRAGLAVHSVMRSDFRTHRDFPGIITSCQWQHFCADLVSILQIFRFAVFVGI